MQFEANLEGFRYTCSVQRHPSGRTPVLFVSGAFQSMASWKKFAEHFARFTTVILCDLPGTGASDVLPSGYRLDYLARALAHVLRQIDVSRVNIVSASYGSPIAYRFAQLFPESVERLVLAGVMKEIPADLRAATIDTLISLDAHRIADCARQIADGLLCTDPEKTVARRDLARRLLVMQLERMTACDRTRYVQNTIRLLDHAPLDLRSAPPVPALVFTGEHDVYTRPDHCREIAAAFDDAIFTTIKEADHLFHIERFEATLALVDWFLRGETPLARRDYGPLESLCRTREPALAATA